jgi:hypothetical protein
LDVQLQVAGGRIRLTGEAILRAVGEDNFGGGVDEAAGAQVSPPGLASGIGNGEMEMDSVRAQGSTQGQDLQAFRQQVIPHLVGQAQGGLAKAADGAEDKPRLQGLLPGQSLQFLLEILAGEEAQGINLEGSRWHGLELLAAGGADPGSPTGLDHRAGASDHQAVIRQGVAGRDGGAGSNGDIGSHLQRSHQNRVGACFAAIPNFGEVLLLAVVVGDDGARADVDLGSQLGIAQ